VKFGSTATAKSAAVEKSIDFEVGLTRLMRQSEQRAWWIAGLAAFSVVIMAIAFVFVMPLKEKTPYLVLADPYTGSASLTKLAPSTGFQQIAVNEAINKANVSHYLIARESYDWEIIGRRDWFVVNSMSAPDVAASYASLYNAANPQNPDTIYGRSKSVRIRIKSLVLSSKNAAGQYTIATVRFDKFLINRSENRIETGQSLIATLTFQYQENLQFEEKYRVENPLGFQVTSYRVDPEYASPASAALLQEITEKAVNSK
jgi:type IV secretion system protein VirB8